jgi:hypothetical protein
MFIGHFALGFAAKRVVPRVSLAVLFAAVAWADLVWPVLVALGIEQVRIEPGNTAFTPLDFISYPYSHSLVMLVLWGAFLGAIYRTATGKNGATFTMLALLVVSHWVLDVVTHRPDMPLYPGGPKLGLGLWNWVTATVLVEVAMYAVGVWIYLRATRPLDGVGRWSFVALALFLVVAYFANLAGGPPPSVQVLWVSAVIGTAILLIWAWWADRHRAPRSA